LILADWRTQPRRVTAEYGSDLSLLCTFQDEESDKTVNNFSIEIFDTIFLFIDCSMALSKFN